MRNFTERNVISRKPNAITTGYVPEHPKGKELIKFIS
jgi:hypothetical protein